MESVKVNITAEVSTDRYGAMHPGDVCVTDDGYARFLVNELKAAEYADAKPAAQEDGYIGIDHADKEDMSVRGSRNDAVLEDKAPTKKTAHKTKGA